MKAAILYELNKDLVIRHDIKLPELKPGQVLVKIHYAGLCHSQLMEARGKRGEDKYLPHMLGHEGTGEIVSIGEYVTKLKPGEKVILGWLKGDGQDVPGSSYLTDDGTVINSGAVTTFSEYAVVSENRCVPLPAGTPLDLGVLYGCAIPTGTGLVVNSIKPKPDSTIAIFGMGGIGLSALLAVNLFNCRKIIVVDVEKFKLDLAKKLGATDVINASDCDPVAVIRDITNGKGVDYSIEAAGHTKTIEQAFHSVKTMGGRCVFASHPPTGNKICLEPHDLISGKKIEGTWGGSCYPDTDIPKFDKLYKKQKFPLSELLSHRYKLDDINIAMNDLESRKIVRALIEINPH